MMKICFADRAQKEKIDLAGLTFDQIDEKLKAAVIKGEEMPKGYWQSLAPFSLETIVD